MVRCMPPTSEYDRHIGTAAAVLKIKITRCALWPQNKTSVEAYGMIDTHRVYSREKRSTTPTANVLLSIDCCCAVILLP